MGNLPEYYNSWKGKVLEAIIIYNLSNWVDIQYFTKLSESSLNTALSELYNLNIITKDGNNYRVINPQIINSYKQYFGVTRRLPHSEESRHKVKDEQHAKLQNLFAKRVIYNANEQTKVEYHFDHYGNKGSIDVIKWLETNSSKTDISIFELKLEIENVQETIHQIHRYRNYILSNSDLFFGRLLNKSIETHLVIYNTWRNVDILKRFKNIFLKSEINYIDFV